MKQWKPTLPGFSAETALVLSSKRYRQGASSRNAQSSIVQPQGYTVPQGKAVVAPQYNPYLCMKFGIDCN